MSKYSDIIERLEKATGPDREIDAQIAILVGVAPEWPWELLRHSPGIHNMDAGRFQNGNRLHTPSPYTSSIDAAIALVERMLSGAELEMTNLYGVARVTLHDVDCSFHGEDHCNRLQTALLIALFRALEAKEAVNEA